MFIGTGCFLWSPGGLQASAETWKPFKKVYIFFSIFLNKNPGLNLDTQHLCSFRPKLEV